MFFKITLTLKQYFARFNKNTTLVVVVYARRDAIRCFYYAITDSSRAFFIASVRRSTCNF